MNMSPDEGMFTLDMDERERLASGKFYLELMTRNHPYGTGREQILPVRK